MYKKTILKNGLRIVTIPMKNIQSVTVLVLVGTGSKYEDKNINGISHFLEHMFFKGTKKRPSTLNIAETLDKVGGSFNAFTGQEYTGYFAKVELKYLDLALDWVSDIYLNSKLGQKEIQEEKGVIIEEINMHYDDPMLYVHSLWYKLLYGDQPAGWDIAGTKENVKRITRKELINYMKTQYSALNTILCIAGNVKPSYAVNKVKKYFSKINKNIPSKKAKVLEKQSKPNLLLFKKDTGQAHLCLGVRGYNLFHPQKYAQDILGIILGGMMSSRLFIEVREKLGLGYYIKTEVETNPDTGFLVTHAGIDNKNVNKAISIILREYKKISQKKVPRNELKKAKDYIKGKTTLSLESSDVQASFYATQELLENKILTPKQIYAKIDKVTQDDILKVAKDIFQPKNLNLALIGPFTPLEITRPWQKIIKRTNF